MQGAPTKHLDSEATTVGSSGVSIMNDLESSKILPRSQRSSPCSHYYSDEDFDLYPPSGKRLAPVGAASNDDLEDMASCQERPVEAGAGGGGASGPLQTCLSVDGSAFDGSGGGGGGCSLGGHNYLLEERLRQMEEDQDELNTSLMSLTSHFAKVSQAKTCLMPYQFQSCYKSLCLDLEVHSALAWIVCSDWSCF